MEKGRYRVRSPDEVLERVAMLREVERNIAQLPQREFVPLLRRFMELVVREYGGRLVSAALFGSVARGDAIPTSDIDLLLVIKGLSPRITDRYTELGKLNPEFYDSPENQQRKREGGMNPIQPVLYTPQEALGVHDIYLDMTQNTVILYDRAELIRKRLIKLSLRLKELGSKRLTVGGKPVWILKPDLKRGEVVTLE